MLMLVYGEALFQLLICETVGVSQASNPNVTSVKYPATSATTCTAPNRLKIRAAPLAPSFTVTRFGMVCPATKLTLDAFGGNVPSGWTVRKLASLGSVAVTFMTTDPAPTDGTPPSPATGTNRVVPPMIGDPVLRVSRMRVGPRETNRPLSVARLSSYQPTTSAITCTAPNAL